MEKQEIFEIIVNNICKVIPNLKNHSFQPEDNLKYLGLNSLDRSEVIDMTMEALSLKIPRVKIFGTENIGELTNLLYQTLRDGPKK